MRPDNCNSSEYSGGTDIVGPTPQFENQGLGAGTPVPGKGRAGREGGAGERLQAQNWVMAGSWGQKQEVRSGVGSTFLRAFPFFLLLLFFSVFWVNFILQNEQFFFFFFYKIVPINL